MAKAVRRTPLSQKFRIGPQKHLMKINTKKTKQINVISRSKKALTLE